MKTEQLISGGIIYVAFPQKNYSKKGIDKNYFGVSVTYLLS